MSSGDRRAEWDWGLLWKLPELRTKHLGRVGPAFGVGIGCGCGFGLGLVGGAGFGPGIPGMQFGFGVGVGCGVGLGFGYGVGRGIAYIENQRYFNIGRLFHEPGNLPSHDQIAAVVDELVLNTRKLMVATSKEIEKWRR
ncbi:hypothetical protein Nepgr_033261 [Nepenthes gracilis]|uniref:Uncharacterized protein n=1 Tax=Nepenthes gracilis TaxID=150966 RepID=A0AAD3TLY9_NEPGR|nr:hypothetical protein Nepgr_033261 [Nepenthes gracilis]